MPLAYVWAEHVPPLAALATAVYARRHGARLAQLVQRRLLLDVVSRDLAAVAGHPRRAVDAGVVAIHRALEQSGFEPIAAHARQLTAALGEWSRSGRRPGAAAGAEESVANPRGLQELCDKLEEVDM